MQEVHHKWHWRYKQKLIKLAVIIAVCAVGMLYLADCPCHADVYNQYVFQPYQLLRNLVFGKIPFSIGDIVYISWGCSLLILVLRWLYYLMSIREYAETLRYAFIKAMGGLASIYLMFMIGWGGNYYKEPLSKYWLVDENRWNDSSIIAFDKYLVQQLNITAPHYKSYNFKEITRRAEGYYKKHTDCYRNGKGLEVKASLFGNWLQYMGVQGYYNPFTGEGQVNKGELHFMLPYVVSHELAHQSGVGAEDDANLLAYALSVQTNDTTFMYSAYFNVWLYTHMQLRMRDTVAANVIKKDLNPITLQHIKELREQRKKYRSKLGAYTGDMYDQYLKLNGQKDGIESYDKVTVSAWLWELQRNNRIIKLNIP
ncbi:MAG: DUF3810 domain-containing protein [Flavipsychrobacter sp.]|nr:DUF3810 domain-containing protein [Flavipsychrobacter sp.]